MRGEVGHALTERVPVRRRDAAPVEPLAAEGTGLVDKATQQGEAEQPEVIGVDAPRPRLEAAHRPDRSAPDHPAERNELLVLGPPEVAEAALQPRGGAAEGCVPPRGCSAASATSGGPRTRKIGRA